MFEVFLSNDEMKLAPCTKTDPELFFPVGKTDPRAKEAIKVCNSCSFRARCLEFALKHNEIGIWGGTTDEQRKALRTYRNIPL